MEGFVYNGIRNCALYASSYKNGAHRLDVVHPEKKHPVSKLTMYCEQEIPYDMIAVDNWKKPEDTVELLRGLGIIDEFAFSRHNGYRTILVYQLTEEGLSLFS